ncbi:Myb-like DNA-binding domain containing protein [Trichomonas vaginalis G3]|uniref:Myb-like DNA-binding domain containing protein n=1 Tax=Trichomonas vaginalis (strain ATCC PRA-98 / G3) TaxID=412133 RepID=A2EIC9_TRIV3|nr:RNA polymerase II transcription regulator recruiting protein [Trichomonas vaginalis G3]EAY07611.1 Myb-like DNA-binding domain containing protein [Trichomonas vaginalis G3]KAI5502503.1 RNA polymerase II transcription regulator recruiting protein [Trichomonas vaginalis G3]|eukprot:XP_001319834.1 Myb-like DNA-binding domain containing protein [Trichomonas vaginalis G3]
MKTSSSHAQPLAPTRVRNKINNCVKNVKWQKEEDELLMKLMLGNMHPNYSRMAEHFPGKTGQQIAERWDKVLNPELVKGSWTRQEDEIIIKFVQENGTKNWKKLCELLPGRIGKQCRERWRNHLDPNINHQPWTPEEDNLLIKYHEMYGNKWVQISQLIPNRSDNAIKNRWNATIKKLVNSTPKPEIETKDTVPSTSPASTPVVQTLISSPFLTTVTPLGYLSPGLSLLEKKSPKGKEASSSLTDNFAKLLEMIPKN